MSLLAILLATLVGVDVGSKPKIAILATGGTIAAVGTSSGYTAGTEYLLLKTYIVYCSYRTYGIH